MPRNARIPQIDRGDKRLEHLADLIAELADERADGDGWIDWSNAARSVVADVLWICEQNRLEAQRVDEPRIVVDGEPYTRLEQQSSVLYHGLWAPTRSRSHCIDGKAYTTDQQFIRSM